MSTHFIIKRMVRWGYELKILKSVILLDAIKVVNMLLSCQAASKRLSHNKSMFKNSPAALPFMSSHRIVRAVL